MAACQSPYLLTELQLSRASSLPHWIVVAQRFGMHRRSPVGASLLAMAACQSPYLLNELPLSRAGSLLHWIDVAHRFCIHRRSPVGAGLPAMAACQSPYLLTELPLSRASSLPHWIVVAQRFGIHRQSPVGASLLRAALRRWWRDSHIDSNRPTAIASRPQSDKKRHWTIVASAFFHARKSVSATT
jgi:hypothetical protein